MPEGPPRQKRGRRKAGGSGRPIVRSVERAARMMQTLLLAGPQGKRVSELSVELGLHKTTVIRLLRTLLALGAVRKDEETGRYCWDPLTWVVLAGQLREPLAAQMAVQQVLEELAKATGATAVVGRPDLGRRSLRLVAYALPECPIRVDPGRMRSVPLHTVAGGKAYLAALGEQELEEWLKGPLPQRTEHSIVSVKELRAELARVRERGYATSCGELFLEAASLGVAVRDGKGEPVGSLDVAGAPGVVKGANVRRWVPLLEDAARSISHLVYEMTVERHEAAEERGAGGSGVGAKQGRGGGGGRGKH